MNCFVESFVEKMKSLHINAQSVPYYLEWIKMIVTLSSAAIGVIFYKFDKSDSLSNWVVFAALGFVISIIAFALFFPALIEHAIEEDIKTSKKAYFSLIFGWLGFMAGFLFLGIYFLTKLIKIGV